MGVKNEKRTDGADAEVQSRTVYRFARSSDGAGTNLLYGKKLVNRSWFVNWQLWYVNLELSKLDIREAVKMEEKHEAKN